MRADLKVGPYELAGLPAYLCLMANNLAVQYFNQLPHYGQRELGFWHGPPVYRLAGGNQTSFSSGPDLFLVATGSGAAAQDDHHVDIIIGQGHQLKIPPLLSHLSQMPSYPAQVDTGIAGTAILQGYLKLTTFLWHLC